MKSHGHNFYENDEEDEEEEENYSGNVKRGHRSQQQESLTPPRSTDIKNNRRSPGRSEADYDSYSNRGNFGYPTGTVSEDEMQVNNILKNLRIRLNDVESLQFEKESEKTAIIEDINVLSQRLKALNKSLAKKKSLYENYDKTVRDAESAFGKITESTKTLLSVMKKELLGLSKVTSVKNENSFKV
jgi:Sjoegren syndrome nuclear autoantigen 1